MGYPQQGPGHGEEEPDDRRPPYGLPGQQPEYGPDFGTPQYPEGYQTPHDPPGQGYPGHDPYYGVQPQQSGGYTPYPQGPYEQRQGGSDDQTMALLAHLSGLLLSFVGPLIFYLIKKDESPYVRHHAAEALNFQITVLIASLVSTVLIVVLIGALLLMAVGIAALVFCIMAAMAANRGEWYRYPINIRLVT